MGSGDSWVGAGCHRWQIRTTMVVSTMVSSEGPSVDADRRVALSRCSRPAGGLHIEPGCVEPVVHLGVVLLGQNIGVLQTAQDTNSDCWVKRRQGGQATIFTRCGIQKWARCHSHNSWARVASNESFHSQCGAPRISDSSTPRLARNGVTPQARHRIFIYPSFRLQ